MWSYHLLWAAVHFLLSLPLNAWFHPRIGCPEWARDVMRFSGSWSFHIKWGVGSAAIHALKLLIIASWTGGAVLF